MQRSTQVVCRAVEGRTHGARLILQAVKYTIDGDRERVELVTRAGVGTPERPHPPQMMHIEKQVPRCG